MVKPHGITSVGRFIVINAPYTYSVITMEKICPVLGHGSHIKVALCHKRSCCDAAQQQSRFLSHLFLYPPHHTSVAQKPLVLCINLDNRCLLYWVDYPSLQPSLVWTQQLGKNDFFSSFSFLQAFLSLREDLREAAAINMSRVFSSVIEAYGGNAVRTHLRGREK